MKLKSILLLLMLLLVVVDAARRPRRRNRNKNQGQVRGRPRKQQQLDQHCASFSRWGSMLCCTFHWRSPQLCTHKSNAACVVAHLARGLRQVAHCTRPTTWWSMTGLLKTTEWSDACRGTCQPLNDWRAPELGSEWSRGCVATLLLQLPHCRTSPFHPLECFSSGLGIRGVVPSSRNRL